jgi:hypothetical protein
MRKLLMVLVLLGTACGSGVERLAQADLLQEFPDAHVQSAVVGEGDSDNAYVHLCFRPVADSRLRSVVWLYQKQDGRWRRTITAAPISPPPRDRCDDEQPG